MSTICRVILTPHWSVEVMEICRYSDKVGFNTELHLASVISGNSNKVAQVLHSINDIPQDSQCWHVDTSLHSHITSKLLQKFHTQEVDTAITDHNSKEGNVMGSMHLFPIYLLN